MKVIATVCVMLMAVPVFATTGITYYHNDALGSPIGATDAAGRLLWRARYRPFGDRDQSALAYGNSLANPLWYTGHVHDDETGLAYFQARYYSPVIGRFMSTDPATVNPHVPATFNRYSYASNNPYRYIDPDGRESIVFSFKGSAVAGTGVGVATGIYVTFPLANDVPFDAGIVNQAAVLSGADLAATVNITMLEGGRENLEGAQVTTSATAPLTGVLGPAVDVEYIINPESGKSVGSSMGVGFAALPSASVAFGGSFVAFSVRDTFYADAASDASAASGDDELMYMHWFSTIAN